MYLVLRRASAGLYLPGVFRLMGLKAVMSQPGQDAIRAMNPGQHHLMREKDETLS